MRYLILTVLLVIIQGTAKAAVPFSSLEELRKQTIVVRVISDFPKSKEVKSCGITEIDFASLGATLEQKTEEAKIGWQKADIAPEDFDLIQKKISVCQKRGSCSVYGDFLATIKPNEKKDKNFSALKKTVDKKLTTLDGNSYLNAWKTIPAPCKIIEVLNQNPAPAAH
jgi:hypothetical protein